MKLVLLFLTLFLFGCSVEKRIHRRGFHFKKSSSFQPSKNNKNTPSVEIKSLSSVDSNSKSQPSKIEHTATADQSRGKDIYLKRTLKKTYKDNPSAHTREQITNTNQKTAVKVSPPIEKKREENAEKKEPDNETHTLKTIANVFAIMSFVFGLLTIVSVALAFMMSLTLILPLLPALAAFFSGGLSLVLGLPIKQDEYKSGFAVIGLVTSLLFIGFFIAVLTGAIWI